MKRLIFIMCFMPFGLCGMKRSAQEIPISKRRKKAFERESGIEHTLRKTITRMWFGGNAVDACTQILYVAIKQYHLYPTENEARAIIEFIDCSEQINYVQAELAYILREKYQLL